MAAPNQPHILQESPGGACVLLQALHREAQHLNALVWHTTPNKQQFQFGITDQHTNKSHLVLLGVKNELKLLARSI